MKLRQRVEVAEETSMLILLSDFDFVVVQNQTVNVKNVMEGLPSDRLSSQNERSIDQVFHDKTAITAISLRQSCNECSTRISVNHEL